MDLKSRLCILLPSTHIQNCPENPALKNSWFISQILSKILTPVTLRGSTFWTFWHENHENKGPIWMRKSLCPLEKPLWSLTFEVDCPGCCQWLLVAGVLALSTRDGWSITGQRRARYRAEAIPLYIVHPAEAHLLPRPDYRAKLVSTCAVHLYSCLVWVKSTTNQQKAKK